MADGERFVSRSAVFVALRNAQGEYLLQRRAGTGYLDGYYDFASSGHLEPGETLQQCAVRETSEEIGVKIAESALKLVHINQNQTDVPYLNFTFLCEEWEGDPVICEPDKADDLRFFARDALPEKCTLNVRVNEEQGFSEELTYSHVLLERFVQLVGARP